MTEISIFDEFSELKKVIVGLGTPYLQNKEQVANEINQFPLIPNTDRKADVLSLRYPTEDQLIEEYDTYVSTLEKYDIEVLFADPAAAYSFDYTCPRDIGFVIGEEFFIANMSVASRADEIKTIEHYLKAIEPSSIKTAPADCLLEGGDVIQLNAETVLVGYNQRSNLEGVNFLQQHLSAKGYRVIPVRHSQLHLDCCLNPLGMGQLLIHPNSLAGNSDQLWHALQKLEWIKVNNEEREYLATNVLSINPETIIARNHPACLRVNREIEKHGFKVEAIGFDGVPATGGSFRCASLPLVRSADTSAGSGRNIF